MITIIVNNSSSRIIGLSPESFKHLRFEVCHFDMNIWIKTRNKYKATTFVIDENGFFPSGLVKKICTYLDKKCIFYHVADNRIIPKYRMVSLKNRLQEPPMYQEQELGVAAIGKSELGILSMPTGIGKSRVIKESLLSLKRPSLIITPSSNLRQQTYEYLTESFGTDDVGLLKFNHDKPIIVTNFHSIASKPPEYFKQFAHLYFDEFHNSAAEGFRDDNQTHLSEIYYRHGVTATPFRNDDSSNIYLESVLSEILYSVTTIEAINKGYIRPLVSFFYDVKNSHLVPYDSYKKNVPHYIDTNTERNAYAIEAAKKMIQNNIPTIVLVDHVAHGRLIKEALGNDAIFLNGQDESAVFNMQKVKEFNQLKIPCLIGTSVLGEGVDSKACGAIVNVSGGKATSELMQKCGRAIRNFPGKQVGYYFDFIDHGQKNLYAHSKLRMSTIKEVYGKSLNIIG